jgi:hypothetical protein
MSEIPVLTLEGTPRNRGLVHGTELKGRVHWVYEQFLRSVETVQRENGSLNTGFSENTLLAFAKAHKQALIDYAPRLYEELEGFAAGAELSIDRILLLNCAAEVRRLMFTDAGTWVFGRAPSPAYLPPPAAVQSGCTCFAAQGAATSDRSVYLGINYDTDPFWEPVLLRVVDGDTGLEQLVMTHPGKLAEFGLNSAGIAFVGSALLVSDRRPGVPAPAVARKLLEQTRLSAAVDAVIRAERTVGIDYVLASPYGVVNLETSAVDYDIHYVLDDLLSCANHVRSPVLRHLQIGLYGADSVVRAGRMLRLLGDRVGVLDLDALKVIQQDHTDYPVGICRHVGEGNSWTQTRSAAIIKPSEGLLLISDGNPCERVYARVRIRATMQGREDWGNYGQS